MHNEADTIALVNTQPRILHLPDTLKSMEGRDGSVTRLSQGDGRSIVPSVPREKDGAPTPTKIDAAYWAYAREKPTVQTWLRLGWLKVLDATAPGLDEDASLAGYNPKTAITLVEVENNPRLLQEWGKTEHRPEVRAALDARLEVLTRPAKLAPLGKGK